ncbi:type VII secretion protein EccCa [Mycolicibacterium celeriflavum]|uniref:Type VII secretion protein EccC n=1 Tax=Mycolicibacterium celeriflavum TaxID=1249101 RepID=A0A1X0BYC4_MYCCF|nr:type VII secretion protein EccCa [Mycolicibacterium celeriflavum]MCV7236811.1 type VII secretion protein EccCa [Mycolicibacterium celeriflavum]ORA49543.1 type VII secretion protein EccC [Mycolicibacterium celeriflavum]BBY43944.1 type VII secretion protein EccC [Mycolicibacterium celeriflavum]
MEPYRAPRGVVVKPPPALPKEVASNPVARLLPVAMLVAAVGMMAVYFTSGAGTSRSPMSMFFPVMMIMSVLGTVAYGARGGVGRTTEIDGNRRSYLRYLDGLDDDIVAAAADQHRSQHRRHPAPDSLWTLAHNRIAERKPDDDDFCCVRVGLGDQELATPLLEPDLGAVDERDPVTVAALRALIRRHSVVERVPIALALRRHTVIAVGGDDQHARGLARAMVCQLAALHGPHLVTLTAVTAPSTRDDWDWLKWLPHHRHLQHLDGGAGDRHVVVIADGAPATDAEPLTSIRNVTVLAIGAASTEAPSTVLQVSVDADRLMLNTADGHEVICRPDSLTRAQALMCARRLAATRLDVVPADDAYRTSAARGWLDLFDVEGPDQINTEKHWLRTDEIRPVPIGVTTDGAPVRIDINEAARNGIGPHGLCVGATGSGKSELLRTLVLGMITSHSPDALNLVLVDFKGGATFLGLERARHVAAVITNLADAAHLVARMNDALAGEVHRRQELLRTAGNFVNVTEYSRARSRGAPLPPLPALFIVVDEFSELLSHHPDFAELFGAIGRLGRSLGIHLLLASQRLDEGRLRGLDTHLSYRICLKTFSASESRAVLGVADAHSLPGTPGAAFLKTAAGELIRFQTAFVSGPCPQPRREHRAEAPGPMLFTAAPVIPVTALDAEPEHRLPAPTLLEVVLDRVGDRGPAAHPVWLPPLAASPSLDLLMHPDERYRLSAPIGLVDSPFQQRHDVLVAQLAEAAGNVAVVGASQSGKSTAVRTLMLALAEVHGPTEIGFYCLDFGGGALAGLGKLPHVGSVSGRSETDLCRRTVALVESLIRSREERFRRMGVDSMTDYRARRAAGDPAAAADPYGDVFLVVDGWAHLRQQFEGLEAPITAIAAQGLAFGVHLIVTASRWAELRPALKDQIATRIELRLGDPAESEMDRRRARTLTNSPPGRGITADGREMVIALPRWDGVCVVAGLRDAITATVDRHRQRWAGQRAPRIELLPTLVAHSQLVESAPVAQQAGRVLVGIGERELRSITVNFAEQPHLLVLGEAGCGKTSLLRLLCHEIVRTCGADEALLEIVDFRRSLLGVVESEHLSGYAASPAALATRLPKLLARLEARMPGESVTQQQLRERSWWAGPEIFLVIDDYDLVAASTGNPLTPLADLLPHAEDLGLHVIVARRSGGAARAMFDPMLARMRELGCMGVMMSASPDDGILLGSVRPSSQPPGRGTLITRGDGEQLVQIGWTDPP